MKTELYVIFDNKAKVYNKPFHQANRECAIRSASSLVNEAQSEAHRHPEDFALFQLGTYDDTSAQIDLLSSPQHVINLHELK